MSMAEIQLSRFCVCMSVSVCVYTRQLNVSQVNGMEMNECLYRAVWLLNEMKWNEMNEWMDGCVE